MKNYIYQNDLIGKKQLRKLLAWSFTNYDSMQACSLADELKYLGFKYATQAGISISIEDLKVPFVKNLMLDKSNQEIQNAEKIYLKGRITQIERFQKIINTWSLTSESLKDQIIYYFKNYDPLNSVYIMAFSGARGNLSQVRQLVGMRGLMSDPSGQIMNLPIKKNFREGLTITDYLMSGYGARKGIVDTALKTANSGYLTRRLIDVAQDILIREKDCGTRHSFLFSVEKNSSNYDQVIGRILSQNIFDVNTNKLINSKNTQITPQVIKKFQVNNIKQFYVRSPLSCNLYRAVCQKCYGWDLASENLVDIGEAVGILAGQSIGEPGTQLTMRTFHTGGIFTSEARQQIISPVNGIIQFYNVLKTVVVRTNRGEDVLVTKNSGSIVLIPDDKIKDIVSMEVLRNTILFPKNNQYITKDTVIGELINQNQQITTEVKPILSNTCGEIFIPKLKQNINILNNNKLIWILSGQLYESPLNAFLNFYPDSKLNNTSHIFRTKIISHYESSVEFINKNKFLSQRLIKIKNKKYILTNTTLQKLVIPYSQKTHILNLNGFRYLLRINEFNSKKYLNINRNEDFGLLISNSFQTLTGGTLYYDFKNITENETTNLKYFHYPKPEIKYKQKIHYKTITWLGEETYQVNCEPNILFVEHGDFISQKFELFPGLYSKTSGLVTLIQKNNRIKTISIKSGVVYEGKKFKNLAKKVYYPGESILGHIIVKELVFCEHLIGKITDQLLVRPIQIYEFPQAINLKLKYINNKPFNLNIKSIYSYKSSQFIKNVQNLSLISTFLKFKTNKLINHNINLQLSSGKKTKTINFYVTEKLSLNNYISPNLRYKNIEACFLIQPKQFLSSYTTLGYLESIVKNSLEIVKFKTRNQITKQIFLISNKDCLSLKKEEVSNKKINHFISSKFDLAKTGKIIIENDKFITIQLGRPYFFPNCENYNIASKTNLQYKTIPSSRVTIKLNKMRNIALNYYNIFNLSIMKYALFSNLHLQYSTVDLKIEFSKLFLKNKGKLYSCLSPQFFKKFSIVGTKAKLKHNGLYQSNMSEKLLNQKIHRTLLLQSSHLTSNQNQLANLEKNDYQLTLVKFLEQPFIKSTKAVGLYSITEDYFEQEVNSVFCKNTEFIEAGKTIGLLNLEKEITGDIVQGLPRIEEILEARKKNIASQRIPMNQKKGLLVQKSSLDINFEFRKVATTLLENNKINPHKLLKVYFNYYGLRKLFLCDNMKSFKSNRLVNNYEGSYKSFKKVQLFILNAVQSVYQSQGVTINDKHLEVIIKQLTTKVLITYEGDTPLSRREVIDLYHIQYIDHIIKSEKKQTAYYIPLLLGITKAALNNPSFISAASFQETTRVLTRSAIEGRIDWLRGLKENIIIGHLIPAGTGSQNYRKSFKQPIVQSSILSSIIS
nr:RNA polymerase beta'' subunit [Cylindrotheca closterium]